MKAFMREVEDPVGLLRGLRRLATMVGRAVDPVELKELCRDLLIRSHAIDPSWATMTEEEIAELNGDSPVGENARGVKQLAMESLGADDRLVASRMGEIRNAIFRISQACEVTPEWAEKLVRIGDHYQEMLADSSVALAPQEQRIWDLLLDQPEDRPLSSTKIVARLRSSGGPVSEENARKSLLNTLREKGVRNRRGAGYYIPSEFRSLPSSK
jgi:hypothetical protein